MRARARPHHEVGHLGAHGGEDGGQIPRHVARVTIHQDNDVRAESLRHRHARRARRAVAALRLHDDDRARLPRDGGGTVCAAVIHDDDVREEVTRQVPHYAADCRLFI